MWGLEAVNCDDLTSEQLIARLIKGPRQVLGSKWSLSLVSMNDAPLRDGERAIKNPLCNWIDFCNCKHRPKVWYNHPFMVYNSLNEPGAEHSSFQFKLFLLWLRLSLRCDKNGLWCELKRIPVFKRLLDTWMVLSLLGRHQNIHGVRGGQITTKWSVWTV